MPRTILDWGLNEAGVEYHPYWRNPFATSTDKDVLVSLWRIPNEAEGRLLVGAFNYDRKNTKDIEVKVDLSKLNLANKQLVLRDLSKAYLDSPLAKAGDPIGCEFWGGTVSDAALAFVRPGQGGPAAFDPTTGVLRIKGVAPHRGRFIGIGTINTAALAEMPRTCRKT